MRVLASCFRCAPNATSESYVGYQWVNQLSKRFDVTVVTADARSLDIDGVERIHIDTRLEKYRGASRAFFGAVKPDYFEFDWRSVRRCRHTLSEFDVVHHIVPQAPRYPCSLARHATRFILGPVGGGLRVPAAFREQVEGSESGFFRLRHLDRLRFALDPMLRATYRQADCLILSARYMAALIPDRYQGNVEYILETGINAADYAGLSERREQTDRVNLLYVGRVVPYKGLRFLMLAIASLPQSQRRALRLDVVGDDTTGYAGECKALCSKLGLTDVVHFRGKLSRSAVQRQYAQSHIFCFPSLAETTGNAVLEAMASGLPIVCAGYGGPGEVVTPDCGVLADITSIDDFVDSLSAGLQMLLEDQALRESFGGNARKRVVQEYTWDAKGERLAKIYDAVV